MIVLRPIKHLKAFQSSIFREEMAAASKQVLAEAVDEHKRTVQTWNTKPVFASKVEQGAGVGGIRFQIGTDDPRWWWLNDGTRVRYATMSKDWQSKTEPNVVQSFPGKGKKLFVNKKRPRPGIKARRWTKWIAKSMRAKMIPIVKNAMARAARRFEKGAG